MIELTDELARIKLDVIGIFEAKWNGAGCVELGNSGHIAYVTMAATPTRAGSPSWYTRTSWAMSSEWHS